LITSFAVPLYITGGHIAEMPIERAQKQ